MPKSVSQQQNTGFGFILLIHIHNPQRRLKMRAIVISIVLLIISTAVQPFQPITRVGHKNSSSLKQQGRRALRAPPLRFFGGSSAPSIPSSPANRDKQAIESIKAAINKPKSPSFPLIECEFPPLEELNKLGDGSLRSARLVDDANLAFIAKLTRGLAPLPFGGPKVRVLTSTAAPSTFVSSATKKMKGAASISSLKDWATESFESGEICIVPSPSSREDYRAAQQLASSGVVGAVVVVNGFAKNQKSMNGEATMAYYLKPLTYNSQVVGYLARKYPSDWVVIDLLSKDVLATYSDSEILYQATNTPDLRGPGRILQKFVDERAIQARKN